MPWAQVDVLVQPFHGATTVAVPVLCNYDLEVAATNYFRSIADGEVPLAFHFNGSVYYRAPDGRLQIVQIPWEQSTDYRMPVAVWKEMIDSYYPYRGLDPGGRTRRSSAAPLQAGAGPARPTTRRWRGCWRR